MNYNKRFINYINLIIQKFDLDTKVEISTIKIITDLIFIFNSSSV